MTKEKDQRQFGFLQPSVFVFVAWDHLAASAIDRMKDQLHFTRGNLKVRKTSDVGNQPYQPFINLVPQCGHLVSDAQTNVIYFNVFKELSD
jgi:hypothetical protein